ncbi:MAG: FAD-binding protein, partial [Fimbriimonadaceae bacterium]|nr:FAD-binding protein [Alphaproteobacteria bacterium]
MSVTLESLGALLGPRSLITTARDIAAYSTDLLGAGSRDVLGVARPDSTDEVSIIVRWCGQNGVNVVPQGGLTGLCSGGVPTHGHRTVI